MTALNYRFAHTLRDSAGFGDAQSLLVAEELLAHLSDLLVQCEDCGGAGNDLCDVCGGIGTRSGGRCRACIPVGSGTLECPTCYGHGYVTRENAESMGWVQ